MVLNLSTLKDQYPDLWRARWLDGKPLDPEFAGWVIDSDDGLPLGADERYVIG